ncbi:MAG TPA: toll/interleukin-1 receptor domain-containing protein [Hyphomicrobiaceae bacterium]
MTGSILTPFTLVAIVIILGCVLAALYFLARRRTPSAKPAPRDGRPPQPRDAPLPRVGFPSPAPGSGLNDGPGRTVLVKPDIPPPMRVPGARPPSRDERPGMEEIEHRRRAANTRLKGERPRPAAGDASESTQERVITAGSAPPPPPPKLPVTVLLPNDDDGRVGKPLPPPAAARPQQPVTKPVEDDEVTTPRRIDPAVDEAKTVILGGQAAEEREPVPGPDAGGIKLVMPSKGPPPRGTAYSVALGPDGRPLSYGSAETGAMSPPRYSPPEPNPTPKPEPPREIVLDDAQSALDVVDCSVFAPPRIAAGERFKVQAHLHLAEQVAKVRRAAAEIDRRANLQGAKSLLKALARGVEVELYLACPGLIVEAPLQKVKWEGTPTHVLFNVEAPAGLAPDPINAAVYLSLDGIPVGDVAFRIYVASVQPADSEDAAVPLPADLATATAARTRGTSYGCAFVSYARKDFDRVSLFAQGLTQREMELAFDVASLEPGADWGAKLPEMIGRCDVFYLMWSDNAARSKWVEKEARLAVWLHHKSQRGAPRIVPITLDRPAPKPPGFLNPFHFDSPWLAQRAAQAMPLFTEAPPQ